MQQTTFKRIRTFVLSVGLFAALGYLSSFSTQGVCASNTRASLSEYIEYARVQTDVRWLPAEELVNRWAAGIPHRERLTAKHRWVDRVFPFRLLFPKREWPLPWGYVEPAMTAWPFIVRVEYGCAMKSHYAQFGTHIYATFYGVRVRVADWQVLLW